MRLNEQHRQATRTLANYLGHIGFSTRPLKFKAESPQHWCTVSSMAIGNGNFIDIEVYVGDYFGRKRPFWVGFSTTNLPDMIPLRKSLEFSSIVLSDDDWDAYNIISLETLSDLEENDWTAFEQYANTKKFWFGRYFALTDNTAEDSFSFIRTILSPFSLRFKKTRGRSQSKITEKEILQFVRVAQSAFREDVEGAWSHRCAVTGCDFGPALRASHVLPWKEFPAHRTDENNGLLLLGTLDTLFDKGFISFEDNGLMKISDGVPKAMYESLGLAKDMRINGELNVEQRGFLKIHRTLIFKSNIAAVD